MDKRYLGFLPIPALVVIIAALYFTISPSVFYEPAWLIPISNTLFVAVICFAVAYIAMRNYKATGRIQILLLGCGVLIFGIGGAIAGFVRGLPGGANLNVTIYNTGALIGALFHFIAAIILLAGISPELGSRQKGTWLVVGYPGVIIFMALLTAASLAGVIPAFFIQSVGPTPLRQGILGTADILFIFSFLIFIGMYFRNKEVFLYWYALALALTSISLTAFFIQHSVGSPVGWAGRFSQYLGGIYFLISLVTATRSARDRRTSLDNVLTASLSPAEEKFRVLAENSPDVIDRFDRELKHIYTNPAGLRLLGKPAGSIIGKTIEETGLPEPYCSLWMERIQKVFETGQSIEVEDYFPSGDGVRFYQSRCVPEYRADGTVANVLVVSHDLTERKRAEEALRASSERYRSYVEVTGQLGWTTNADGEVVEDMPSWRKYTGQTYEEIKGWGWSKALHPDDLKHTTQAWKNATTAKSTYEVEYRIRRHDGIYRHFLARGVPVLKEDGSMQEWVGTCIDITERKKAEEALAAVHAEVVNDKNRLEAVMQALPEGLAILDARGGNIACNSAFKKIWGSPLPTVCAIDDYAAYQAWWADTGRPVQPEEWASARAVHHGETVIGQEMQIQRFDGTRAFVLNSATPIRDSEGRVTGCAVAIMDITERKRAENVMQARLRMVTAAYSGDISADEVLRLTLDELEAQTGSVIGFYHFLEADQETLLLQNWSTNTVKTMCNAEGKGSHYNISQAGVWVDCVREKRPVIHNEYAILPHRKGMPEGHAKVIREMVIPIMRGERIVAIIGVGNKPTDYNETDVEIASLLGDFSWEIVERKRMEEALRESEEQFHTLADSIPNLAWWANGDGFITWYNRRWYEYTGTTPEQMEGWGWQSVHDPKVLPKVLERWKASIATGQPFDMEFPLRGADGVFRPFLTRVLPLKDSAGLVLRWFGTNTDISARKQAEEALRESEKQYRELFENMIEGFAYCKMVFENGKPQDFIYLSVNHAFESLTGLKNVVGKRVTEVIPGIRETDPELIEIYGRVSLTGKPERFEMFVEALKMWFSISVYSPEKEFFVAVFDIITERKKAEEQIRALNEQLKHQVAELDATNKELDSFSYSVSHDLRAPLRTISGFTKILTEDYAERLDVQGRDYMNRVYAGSKKMSKLIEDLSYLSRISRQDINRIEFSISNKASSIVADLREVDPDRSVEVSIQYGLAAFADPGLTDIVLSNLLGNSWKFTSKTDNARIEFSAFEQDGKTVYYVRDNGAGFNPQYKDKLFRPFHRLHSDQEFEGTGIGLSIVGRIVRHHGGRVWAEGETGKGATFFFTLN
jgi:PAS domain S-box-containing protein